MSWQAYVDDHLMREIEGNHLTAAAIIGHDGTVWAQSANFPQIFWFFDFLPGLFLDFEIRGDEEEKERGTQGGSPSVGNLTRMQWMTIGINALSGEVPPEIGLLTDLRSLAFGTNNFNGSLPSEIGNLQRLQQLYIDSAGVGGEISSTFANLTSLVTGWASDNEFTGRIPNFIGNWTQLQSLRFEGNAFEGSIPPSFSRLTSLQDLRISGLSNGTLDFITDLKSLTVL